MSDQASDKGDTQSVVETAPETDASLWAEIRANEAKSEAPTGADDETSIPEGTEPAPEAGKVDDIWAGVPETARKEYEDLKAEAEKLKHQVRSANGRVAARQRRLNELEATIKQPASTRDHHEVAATLQSLEEDYPEIAQPLKTTVQTINSKIDALDADRESRRKAAETERNDIINEETAKLDEEIPGWGDLLKTHGKTYLEWIEDQPKRLREAHQRNLNSITDADAAIETLTAFRQFLEQDNGGGAQPAPQTQRTTVPSTDRRLRQLAGSSSPSSSARVPVVSGIPEDGDPQAIWNAIREEERRRAS
jgi:hypothetical protein